MKIQWHVDASDVEKVQSFLKSHQDSSLVKERIALNLRDDKPAITKDEFWYRMVVCLLMTQQRSGPSSAVERFSKQTPFPLRYDVCVRQGDLLNSFAWQEMTNFGRLNFSGRTAGELVANLHYLENNDGWHHTMSALDKLRLNQTAECEREAAEFIDSKFDGFGPKQSRNLLQSLGLSRHEIPLDSRITKWLNDFGFPVVPRQNRWLIEIITASCQPAFNGFAMNAELCRVCSTQQSSPVTTRVMDGRGHRLISDSFLRFCRKSNCQSNRAV